MAPELAQVDIFRLSGVSVNSYFKTAQKYCPHWSSFQSDLTPPSADLAQRAHGHLDEFIRVDLNILT